MRKKNDSRTSPEPPGANRPFEVLELDLSGFATYQDLTSLGLSALLPSDILACMDNLSPDGLAIPDEKRGPRHGWPGRVCASIGYASLACSLSFWLVFALYCVQVGLRVRLPGWRWIDSIANWQWVLFEAFALLLAIVAAVFRARFWPIALPLAFLTLLLTYYATVS